jgi:hypothetical protein
LLSPPIPTGLDSAFAPMEVGPKFRLMSCRINAGSSNAAAMWASGTQRAHGQVWRRPLRRLRTTIGACGLPVFRPFNAKTRRASLRTGSERSNSL